MFICLVLCFFSFLFFYSGIVLSSITLMCRCMCLCCHYNNFFLLCLLTAWKTSCLWNKCPYMQPTVMWGEVQPQRPTHNRSKQRFALMIICLVNQIIQQYDSNSWEQTSINMNKYIWVIFTQSGMIYFWSHQTYLCWIYNKHTDYCTCALMGSKKIWGE